MCCARTALAVTFLALPPTLLAQPKDSAGPADPEKFFARCVDSSALVFGSEGTKEPTPVAGALVLDRDRRLLIAQHHGVPDDPTVVFPAYTDTGKLRNKRADYVELWKKGERWKGRVLHRDRFKTLVVIELDKDLPVRAHPAEFAGRSAAPGSTVYAVGQFLSDPDFVWTVSRGQVRSVGKVLPLSTGHPASDPPSPVMVSSTAPRNPFTEFGMFDPAARVVGLPSKDDPSLPATIRVDVTEARAFLTEKKVPFRSAPAEPAAKEGKAK